MAKSATAKKASHSHKKAARATVKAKSPASSRLKQAQKAKKPVAKLVRKAAPAAKKQAAAKPPVKSLKLAVSKPAAPAARKPEAARPVLRPQVVFSGKRDDYRVGHYVVYPTHGVGRIVAEETQQIGDVQIKMLVISFEKDKMTLRVPVHRAAAAGLRHVSGDDDLQKMFSTLKGRARASRGMWSRRAQEYEAKINSGNIHSIAEVVRDLHQNMDQAERSYSERMIYESAFGRLVGEVAASESLDSKSATEKLIKVLKARAA